MIKKFVYSCSIKVHALGFDELLESIFCLRAFSWRKCGSIFSAKSSWDAWRSGSLLVRGQENMVDETELRSPIHSAFKALVVWHAVGCVMENWALTVDQCRLQALQFSVHFNDLLSIVLRYNGSIGIQRVVVGQTWQQTTSDHELFLMQVWLWEGLWSFFIV